MYQVAMLLSRRLRALLFLGNLQEARPLAMTGLCLLLSLRLLPVALQPPPQSNGLPTVLVNSANSAAVQQLPQSMTRAWPVWIAQPDGSSVTLVPGESTSEEEGGPTDESDPLGWVDPVTFDQLWLPEDLPLPQSNAAVGLVLKDGVPRYLFPTIVTIVQSGSALKGGLVWYNRGLNSLPLGKQWLPFSDVPTKQLRISCYSESLPPRIELEEDADEAAQAAAAEAHAEAVAAVKAEGVTPHLTLAEVDGAVEV